MIEERWELTVAGHSLHYPVRFYPHKTRTACGRDTAPERTDVWLNDHPMGALDPAVKYCKRCVDWYNKAHTP
jgi:hypothetical protein